LLRLSGEQSSCLDNVHFVILNLTFISTIPNKANAHVNALIQSSRWMALFIILSLLMTPLHPLYAAFNVISGDYCESHIDIDLAGLKLERFYNGPEEQQQLAGVGWHFNHPNIATVERYAPGISPWEYHFDERHRLVRLESSGCPAKRLDILYSGESHCSVQTADGLQVSYQYTLAAEPSQQESRWLLEKVVAPDGGWTSYTYERHPTENRYLISRRDGPDGHFLINEYYPALPVGISPVGQEDPCRQKSVGHLWRQLAPVGDDGAAAVTHHFSYGDGQTFVRDALGNLTIYRYGEHSRLTAIESYWLERDGSDQLYRIERFRWKGSPGGPLLTSQSLEGSAGNVETCTTYTYDLQGNRTSETLWGNLTGREERPLLLDNKGRPLDDSMESYTVQYEYNSDTRRLQRRIEDNGSEELYQYDAETGNLAAKLILHQGAIRQRYLYSYDAKGLLIEERIDSGNSAVGNCLADQGVVEFNAQTILRMQYCDSEQLYGQVAEIQELRCEPHSQQERLLRRFTYRYTASGRVEGQEISDGDGVVHDALYRHYDAVGRTIFQADGNGRSIERTYDSHGNIVKEICRDLGGQSSTTRYSYDLANRMVASYFSECDSEELGTHYRYDIAGNLIAISDTCGNTTLYAYDCAGRRIKASYPQVLDSADLPITIEEHWKYDLNHRVIAATDGEGHTTLTRYNVRGKPIEIIYPNGSCERFYYSLDGQLQQAVAKNGSSVEYSGGNGAESGLAFFANDGSVLANSCADGRKKSVPKKVPTVANSADDAVIVLAKQQKHTHCINDLGQVVRQEIEIAENGYRTTRVYDALGRLTQEMQSDSFGAQLSGCEMRYDRCGRKVKEVHRDGEGNFTYVISYCYRADGQLEVVVEGEGSLTEKVTSYSYNAYDQLIAIETGGIYLEHSYNALGQLSHRFSSDGTVDYQYEYDQQGNCVAIHDLTTGSSTHRQWDERGLLVGEQLGNGLAMLYSYDDEGHKVKTTLPDGSAVGYTYRENKVAEVQRLYPDGSLHYRHIYHADGSEAMIGELGAVISAYDEQRRLTKIATPYWSMAIDVADRDATGNVLNEHISESSEEYTCSYSYDSRQQLIAEAGIFDGTYSYDYLGNRLDSAISEGEAKNKWSNSAVGMPTTVKGTSAKFCEYDALQRLTAVVSPGIWRVEYRYDAFDRRIEKSIGVWNQQNGSWDWEAQQLFLYDHQLEIGAYDDRGTLVELRILGDTSAADLAATVALELKGKLYGAITDRRGSICCLVDAETKRGCEYYRYSAFGTVQIADANGQLLSNSKVGNPWMFCSKRCDRETGWSYFGRRYYCPELMRWLTPDPLGLSDGPNRHTFVHNNPVNYADLYGLWTLGTDWQQFCSAVAAGWQKVSHLWKQVRDYAAGEAWLHEQMDRAAHEALGPTLLMMFGYYSGDPEAGSFGYGECDERVRITFANGILNVKNAFNDSLEALSATHGHVIVHYVFRPTGGWTMDLIDGLIVRFRGVTWQARQMASMWRSLIAEMGGTNSGGTIYHYAHSMGSGITYVARDLLTPEEQQMIHVITLGSPIMVPSEGFASVTNYVSVRDGIPFCDFIGHLAAYYGGDSQIEYVGDFDGMPFVDHLFNSPSYFAVISGLGQRFISNHH
jgi:RHS repeat-associated protein